MKEIRYIKALWSSFLPFQIIHSFITWCNSCACVKLQVRVHSHPQKNMKNIKHWPSNVNRLGTAWCFMGKRLFVCTIV